VSRNQILMGVIVLALLILGGVAWYTLGDHDLGTGGGTSADTATPEDRTLGDPKAKIVAIEYAAPMCPHCAHMNETGFPILKRDYIDTGKVFYIFRVFPIGNADIAAEGLARCQPANNYFAFIDLLFRNQAKWDPENGITDVEGALTSMARIAGMPGDKALSCMKDQDTQKHTLAVAQDAATRYGISGVPTFVVNGEVLPSGAPWETVKAKLDSLLAGK